MTEIFDFIQGQDPVTKVGIMIILWTALRFAIKDNISKFLNFTKESLLNRFFYTVEITKYSSLYSAVVTYLQKVAPEKITIISKG